MIDVTVANGISAAVKIGMLIAIPEGTITTPLAFGNGTQHGKTLIIRQKRHRFLYFPNRGKKGVLGIEVEIVVGGEKEDAVVRREPWRDSTLMHRLIHSLADGLVERGNEAAIAGRQHFLLDGAAVGVEQREGGPGRGLRQTVGE